MRIRPIVPALLLCAAPAAWAEPCRPAAAKEATPGEIRAFFDGRGMQTVTFMGYSGAKYEEPSVMLALAGKALEKYVPQRTIVLIGATREGIGAVYDLAKSKGFTTAGIVSSQAKVNNVPFSPCVDHLFVVEDATWGGIDPKTKRLSPTSAAMVENSDVMVAIGGGDIARDEMTAARRAGKPIEFHAADMNHKVALERAKKRGEPAPTNFSGSAAAVFGKRRWKNVPA
jgi:hypothetical protein